MTRPVFNVHLKGSTAIIDQRAHRDVNQYMPGYIFLNEGPPIVRALGEWMTTTGARTYYSFQTWVYILSTGPSRPFDKLRAYVWSGTAPYTLLATSNESYDADDILKNVEILLTWTFPAVSAPAGSVIIGVMRDGSPSYNGYWRLRYHIASQQDVIPEGNVWFYNGTTWAGYFGNGNDLAHISSRIDTFDHDISQYVKEITTDIGKNDIGGDYKEGKCSITLSNLDDIFYPHNSSSPYYGHFDIGIPVEFTIGYGLASYPGFKGNIVKIDPPFPVTDRDVFVDVADVFERLKSRKVSLGTQSGKTASQLVLLVLQAAGITSYSIMGDSIGLATVTWNEQGAMDLLKKIVEVGQHHHYVGPDGVYYFKTNQWAGSGLVTLDLDDPCVIAEDASSPLELGNIVNRIRIKYPTNNWVEQTEPGSIYKHGQRDMAIDNELMPSQSYAAAIASYILRLKGDGTSGADITLQDAMPQALTTNIGSLVRLVHGGSGLDQRYRVAGITKRFRRGGISQVDLRCEKYIYPPEISSYYDYEYITTLGDIVDEGDQRVWHAQSFMVPQTGKLLKIRVKVKTRTDPYRTGYNWMFCYLYSTDGSQLPNVKLDEADQMMVNYDNGTGIFDDYLEFTFPGSYNMVAGTRYAWVLRWQLYPQETLGYFRVYGSNSNLYPDGIPSASITGVAGSWAGYSNREYWARIRVQQ